MRDAQHLVFPYLEMSFNVVSTSSNVDPVAIKGDVAIKDPDNPKLTNSFGGVAGSATTLLPLNNGQGEPDISCQATVADSTNPFDDIFAVSDA